MLVGLKCASTIGELWQHVSVSARLTVISGVGMSVKWVRQASWQMPLEGELNES